MTAAAQPHLAKFDHHFRDEICRQDVLGAAATTLAEAAHELGWDLAAFHASIDVPELPRADNGSFVAERLGWSSAYLEGWRRFKLGVDCPVAAACARTTEPFFWTCDDRHTSWFGGEFNDEQRRVMDYYGLFVASGVAVPVRRGACTAYVSWCSRDRDRRDLASDNLGSMFYISHVFIRHVELLLTAHLREREPNELTEREIECLTWAARGKCEEVIAMLLSRSRDTVHFHLRNAMRKLDATNRTHAVAIACSRGLISLQ